MKGYWEIPHRGKGKGPAPSLCLLKGGRADGRGNEGGREVGNMWRAEEAEASHSNTEENDR